MASKRRLITSRYIGKNQGMRHVVILAPVVSDMRQLEDAYL